MRWVQFTEADVIIPRRELDTYENMGAENYPDSDGNPVPPAASMLPTIITQVISRFRGEIQSNPNVSSMGPDGTIPDWCVEAAAILTRDKLIGLPPVADGYTDPRQTDHRDAQKLLESLKTRNQSAFREDVPADSSSSANYGGLPLLDF